MIKLAMAKKRVVFCGLDFLVAEAGDGRSASCALVKLVTKGLLNMKYGIAGRQKKRFLTPFKKGVCKVSNKERKLEDPDSASNSALMPVPPLPIKEYSSSKLKSNMCMNVNAGDQC